MADYHCWITITLVIVCYQWHQAHANYECTSNQQCVIFTDCRSLVDGLRRGQLSESDRQQYPICGFVGKRPLVCCNRETSSSRFFLNQAVLDKLLPSLDECGATSNDRIVGGEDTGIDEFPWMAIIFYKDVSNPRSKEVFGCAGSLISPKYVLTAAHCISNVGIIPYPYKPTYVRLGEWDVSTDKDCLNVGDDTDCVTDPVQNIPIDKTTVHEEWNEVKQHNDIALIRLQRPARYNYYVRPICLPVSAELLNLNYHDAKFEIAGWGTTAKKTKSSIKQKLLLPEVDLTLCKQKYENLERMPTYDHICAGGEPGRDSCKADSGGPLMKLQVNRSKQFWFLAGIVSYGPTVCGTEGVPGVYTKVSSFMPWISANLKL